MGAFFSNLQIKNTVHDNAFDLKIIDCITTHYSNLGYYIVEDEKDADKSIILAKDTSTSWYSVYDDDFELTSEELPRLATFLSDTLNAHVISTMVGDSDYLKISLYDKAKAICNIDNFNDNLSFTFSELSNWSYILSEGKTIEDISDIFKANEVFVEKYLDHLAPLFNISPLYWTLGYRYFEEIIPDSGIKLHFAKIKKIKEEEPKVPLQPYLLFSAYGSGYNLKTGEPYPLSFQISNMGASTTGMEIILVGDAIEQEIIYPSDMQIQIGGIPYPSEVSFQKTTSTDKRKLWVAELNDIFIPEGKLPPSDFSKKEHKKYLEYMNKSSIALKMNMTGVKQSKTSFSVFAIPLPRGCGQSAYIESIEITIE